jgi:hypothetical protein
MHSRFLQPILISLLGLIVAIEATLLFSGYFGGFSLSEAVQRAKPKPKPVAVVVSPKDRIDEVQKILDALEVYNKARKTYPETIQALVPKYLEGPSDPALGFSPYRYVPVGDPIEYFTLQYSLSADYGTLVLGPHVAGPKGLTGGEYPLSQSDIDNDGLDDTVEIYVYRTDSQKADTDGDGFSDGVEVSSGHNPRSL